VTDAKTDANGATTNPSAEQATFRRAIWPAILTLIGVIVAALIGAIATVVAANQGALPSVQGPTVYQTQTIAPTATATETVTVDPSGNSAPPAPTADETALDTTWNTTADEYYGETGKTVVFDCPSAGIPQDIWGGPYYSYDSSVCTAAVHNGRITLKKGGQVTIQIREGLKEYKASRSNGITSQEWPESGTRSECSFEFLPRR
jgi:LCCL domain